MQKKKFSHVIIEHKKKKKRVSMIIKSNQYSKGHMITIYLIRGIGNNHFSKSFIYSN